jgi:DNA-binding transcriptional MerR regulator
MTVSLVARAADRPSSHRPSTAWVARALRAQGMPRDEVRALLSADDAEVVHRFVELHEERLQEQLATRIRTIRDIERSLTASRRR